MNSIILEPLIRHGYLDQILDYSVPATTELLSSELVGHVHLTGSLSMANAVKQTVKKSRPEFSQEKIDAMVTSELGCATPCIIPNENFTNKELLHTARITPIPLYSIPYVHPKLSYGLVQQA